MKLAFTNNRYDIGDLRIQSLSAEYEPQTIKEAWEYIRNNRKVSYYNIFYDFNTAPVMIVDYGSWSEFCYLWDLTDENIEEFTTPIKKCEQDSKEEFAKNVLNELKARDSLTYEEALAIHKMLGGN